VGEALHIHGARECMHADRDAKPQQNEKHDRRVADVELKVIITVNEMAAQKLALPGFDFEAAKIIAMHALEAIREGKSGYAIVVASKMP
jgi:hypothetical protein